LQEIFKRFEVAEIVPSPAEVKEAFNNRHGHNEKTELASADMSNVPSNFYEAFDDFVRVCGRHNDWTHSTFENFATVKNHLKNFRSELSFEFFDEEGLTKYVQYLREVREMRNSTIGKQLSFLKWFLRWSFKQGMHSNNAYDTFKPKLKDTQKKIIFLTWEELNKLREFKIPPTKQALERVRDVFLFQCFTGLRYSDVFNLRRSDIKGDHIEVTTVKTSDSLIIELNDHSRAIIEKYKDVEFENDKALPVITNQKMNDYLKELAELAEIIEPVRQTYYKGNERIDEVTPKYALLGTHAGRRTFICNALALGIPPQVVMKWTGHSDYKAMKPYIDIADDIKASAMSKFNQL
jgi:integrase